MSKPKPPAPPDPIQTASAQTASNVSTAIANAALKNVNQVTPYGNLKYSETGSKSVYDPSTGTTYSVPIYTATQTLSPNEQALLDKSETAKINISDIANQQSSFLKDYLSHPANFDELSKSASDKLFQLGKTRLDPLWDQRRSELDTSLANKGIQAGSEAYDRAYRQFNEGRNDSYNQLALSGQGQAFTQAVQSRQEPINELTALLSGSQVTPPSYVPTNQPTIPTTDYAGIVNQGYQNQLGAYNARAAQSGALTGGLFSLLSAPLVGFSDRRLKKDIKKVDKVNGHNIYKFRYKSGGPMQLGVMAQEVEKKKPSAVMKDPVSGYKMVDYGKVFRLGTR